MAVMEYISSRKGFTLIEIVVVMAIIAVLSILVIGAIVIAKKISTNTKYLNDGKTTRDLLEKYYSDNGYYPWKIGITEGISRTNVYSFYNEGVTPNAGRPNADEELKQYLLGSSMPTGDPDMLCYSSVAADKGQKYYLWYVTEDEARKDPPEGCHINSGGWPGANKDGAIRGPNMGF